MPLHYNNSAVTAVKYNGNDVTSVYYNNTLVWTKYVEPVTEAPTEATAVIGATFTTSIKFVTHAFFTVTPVFNGPADNSTVWEARVKLNTTTGTFTEWFSGTGTTAVVFIGIPNQTYIIEIRFKNVVTTYTYQLT